jgi:hypothetical protein
MPHVRSGTSASAARACAVLTPMMKMAAGKMAARRQPAESFLIGSLWALGNQSQRSRSDLRIAFAT